MEIREKTALLESKVLKESQERMERKKSDSEDPQDHLEMKVPLEIQAAPERMGTMDLLEDQVKQDRLEQKEFPEYLAYLEVTVPKEALAMMLLTVSFLFGWKCVMIKFQAHALLEHWKWKDLE